MAVVFLPGSVLRLLSSGSTFLECAAGCLIVCAGIGRDATTPPAERYLEHDEDGCQVSLGSSLGLTRVAGTRGASGSADAPAGNCVPLGRFYCILFPAKNCHPGVRMDRAAESCSAGHLCGGGFRLWQNDKKIGDRKMREGFAASVSRASLLISVLHLPVSSPDPLRGLSCENTPRGTPRSGKREVLLTNRQPVRLTGRPEGRGWIVAPDRARLTPS